MKCGIIGLPNVGKSMFFNIISNSNVPSKNFPFCTIEPNYGKVRILDHRLYELKKIVNTEKIIPSEIEIIDIAGLIKDSHKGNGLGNKFLSHVRESKLIIHIVRFFKDLNVVHIENRINPIEDKEIIDTELQLKDLDTLEKKLVNLSKKNLSENFKKISLIKKIILFIEKGNNIRTFPFEKNEKNFLYDLQLLTIKPIFYICNIDKEDYEKKDNIIIKKFRKIIKKEKGEIIFLSLKDPDIKWKLDKFFKKILELLNLKVFFTVGKKEIRSWIIPNNYSAYESSSVIHTEFKKRFIKVEIIKYNDFIKYKSEKKLKKLGKIFLAGKNYIIKNGDIVFFKLNKKIF